MCVCVRVYVCICVYVYVCMCMCVHVCVCACVHVCMCVCVCVCMCACVHVCVHVCSCITCMKRQQKYFSLIIDKYSFKKSWQKDVILLDALRKITRIIFSSKS